MGKSCLLIPERFAIAMVDDGWILRNKIVWYKRSCMPKSASDAFTPDWEHIFFFVKSNKTQYWTNDRTLESVGKQPKGIKGVESTDWELIDCRKCEATGMIAESLEINDYGDEVSVDGGQCPRCKGDKRVKSTLWSGHDYYFEQQFEEHVDPNRIQKNSGKRFNERDTNEAVRMVNANKEGNTHGYNPLGRNMRTVWNYPKGDLWDITPKGYSEAHFATYPEDLCITPIKAGCPKEICVHCGKAREKVINTETLERYELDEDDERYRPERYDGKYKQGMRYAERTNVGLTDCGCRLQEFRKGIVLDPFMGSGTTAVAARRVGVDYVGIEPNPEYIALIEKRLAQEILEI